MAAAGPAFAADMKQSPVPETQYASPNIAPPAAWVDVAAVDSAALRPTPPEDAVYGLDYLLRDHQEHVSEASVYRHEVYRVVNDGSLQSAASFTWDFEPSYEQLTLHHLRVIRNGVTQDRLDPARIQILRQETELERHMLNGRLTALIQLGDVRIGDVIDFASTIQGRNPVFGDRWYSTLGLGWYTPVRNRRARVLVPEGRDLHFVDHGKVGLSVDQSVKYSALAKYNVFTWQGSDLPAIDYEGDAPAWFVQWPFVQLSESRTWAEVVWWAEPLYALPDPLPEMIREQAQRLAADHISEEERIIALLQFVQQEIRYLGLELEAGTHRPTAPAEVLARRFGDCKDKSILLCALLRALGIEAYPALVNTTQRGHVADWGPSPHAFNHVIVAIPTRVPAGREGAAPDYWWVDPTLTFQGGDLNHRALPRYQLALLIRSGENKLTAVVPPDMGRDGIQTEETFDIVAFDQPAGLRVVTHYTGNNADYMRSVLRQTAATQIARDHINYYAVMYPGLLESAPMSWDDDQRLNRITVNEFYSIPAPWEKIPGPPAVVRMDYEPRLIMDFARRPSAPVRTLPLKIGYPSNVKLSAILNLPKPWSLNEQNERFDTDAFSACSQAQLQGARISLNYEWRTNADHVPPDKIAEHLQVLDKFRNSLGLSLTYTDPAAADGADTGPAVNWLFLLVVAGALSASIAAAIVYYRRRYKAPPPLPFAPEPLPVGGWLILVGLGVALRPVLMIFNLSAFKEMLNFSTWQTLTDSASELYRPYFGIVVIVEAVANCAMLVLAFLSLVLFFQKSRRFPILLAIILIAYAVVTVADILAIRYLVEFETEPLKTMKQNGQMLGAILTALIWVPYLYLSDRVKKTFIRP